MTVFATPILAKARMGESNLASILINELEIASSLTFLAMTLKTDFFNRLSVTDT